MSPHNPPSVTPGRLYTGSFPLMRHLKKLILLLMILFLSSVTSSTSRVVTRKMALMLTIMHYQCPISVNWITTVETMGKALTLHYTAAHITGVTTGIMKMTELRMKAI